MQPTYWVTLCILWYVIIYRQMQKKKFIKNRHKNRKGGIKEMEEIIKALEDEPIRWKAMTYLLIDTGCRRSEVMGLKWENVELDTGVITIESAQ